MLRSEITELEKSVGAILNITGTANKTSYHNQIVEQVTYVKNLCSELRKKWTHELLSNAKEQVIKRYVQYHQAGIIQLSDMVSRRVPALDIPEEERKTLINSYGQVNTDLEQVLEFLRNQFYQYFDIDHKTTINYCQVLSLQFAALETELKAFNNSAVDRSLIDVVLISVNEIVAEGSLSGTSYRQAEQALNLLRITHQLLLFGTNTTTDTLLYALYQQNLNTLHFYNWYQDHLLAQFDLINDQKDRQAFINQQIKVLAGIFVSPEKALQPELPATDAFIGTWLQEQTNSEFRRAKINVAQFPLNLSVPQFALFIRIFYKTGCFPIENVAMITRFFTEHFTTKKQPHISSKSFGRAFYSLDQSAAAVVRDYLQKMLNYLNKTYFP